MTADPGELVPRELDPLPTSSVGTALAAIASLLWPELVGAAVSLAALASFVLWLRALRVLRQRRTTGYRPVRLVPLLALGTGGWSVAFLLGPILPPARGLLLGVVCLGLWSLAPSAGVGI